MSKKELEPGLESGLESELSFFAELSANLPTISIEELLAERETFAAIIDVRSEKEFLDSRLPGAVNFPILNNEERHKVGWTYKKVSREKALQLALKFAAVKTADFFSFASALSSGEKPLLIYCFRGGGRSAYSTGLLQDKGFNVRQLIGGHKAYRKIVYAALYEQDFPKTLVLKGLTGTGKTELIRLVQKRVSCLDLEFYARNSASSFGRIPFFMQENFTPISQKHFEDQLFVDAFLNKSSRSVRGILVESESRRVGNVHLPPKLFEAMLASESICFSCSIAKRVERIYLDYIGSDKKALPFFTKGLQNLKKYVSGSVFAEYIKLLEADRLHELIEVLLTGYYDKKYSGIYKQASFTINTDNIENAAAELLDYLFPAV